jgi:hypothetical protein
MQCRSAWLVSALVFLTGTAGAAVPRTTSRIAADTLTAMPAAGVAKPLRAQRDVRWSHPPTMAWNKLAATGAWQAAWDRATGVPNRIWGSGLAAPGANASAEVAAAFARAVLADHIALLAPGAALSDFELVSNHDDGDIRSIGFVQRSGGRIVVGGQLSFRFKNDRLFLIGSEALPHIALPAQPRARTAPVAPAQIATSLRRELALPDAPVTASGDEVVLPLVADDVVLGYRIAIPVTIDGGADGRYLAYCDPATGEPLAVRQMNLYATGTVLYRSVDRYPGRQRIDRPAPRARVMLNNIPQTTTTTGQLSWSDTNPQTVVTSVVGDLVAVVNKGVGGMRSSTQLSLDENGEAVWDASASVDDDAQVQTYLGVSIAKDFARELDPNMATLDAQIVANVNIGQSCNAFYDGTTVNFFRASSNCQNTGLLHDVVFHEFGHAFHTKEIIPGVGSFDAGMSEGVADFFATLITGDPAMGRGFFHNDNPLRHIDPPNFENRWPQDLGEVHKTGLIFGGTFWDLRKALIEQLGETEGIALTKKLYVGAVRRSTSIPASLLEALATDDDDGNLLNGTPHECAIRDVYGRHGMRTATGVIVGPDRITLPTAATTVHINLSGLAEQCAGDELASAELIWKTGNKSGRVAAVQTSPTEFFAELPLEADDKILYQAKIEFRDTSQLAIPDNIADPFYEVYQGRTVPLYCIDFEAGDPLTMGWTTASKSGGASPWSWGIPAAGTSDPRGAFTGSHVVAQMLNGDYPKLASSYLAMPPIDVGQWSDVRLQYRRWLAVEDSHYDKARILVGDKQAWVNFTQDIGDSSSVHHIDREWRFHDVAVSGYQMGHTLDISWDLTADEGLEFGGWAIDDVCVVANVNGVCGDGVITAHEVCDDGAGNANRPNACRTWCQMPACGDGIVDDEELCDDGPTGSDTCSMICETVGREPAGCCSAQRGPGASWLLAGLALMFALRRRRPGAAPRTRS